MTTFRALVAPHGNVATGRTRTASSKTRGGGITSGARSRATVITDAWTLGIAARISRITAGVSYKKIKHILFCGGKLNDSKFQMVFFLTPIERIDIRNNEKKI